MVEWLSNKDRLPPRASVREIYIRMARKGTRGARRPNFLARRRESHRYTASVIPPPSPPAPSPLSYLRPRHSSGGIRPKGNSAHGRERARTRLLIAIDDNGNDLAFGAGASRGPRLIMRDAARNRI
jgi:hypothetical protein